MPSLPLAGIRVLALEQAVAGPLATRHLADLGAEVIKIERPGGGDFARTYDTAVHGLSSYFVWLNRGKQSLTLDLKQPEAIEILRGLIARSDVLVQNLGPGAIDRLGFPPVELRQSYPELVICSISGFGSSGPYLKRKAFDLLLQGETGVIATTGAGNDLAKLGISVGDIGAGVYGAMATLAALYQRQITGQGMIVESSLFDALAEFMGYPAYNTLYGGTPPARAGYAMPRSSPTAPIRAVMAIWCTFRCKRRSTGRFLHIVCEHPEWIADPRFDTTPHRRENRDVLEPMIEEASGPTPAPKSTNGSKRPISPSATSTPTNSSWSIRNWPLGTAGAPSIPSRPAASLLPPFVLEEAELAMGDIPAVGAHTDAILSSNEIRERRHHPPPMKPESSE